MDTQTIERALLAVGELLAEQGEPTSVVIIGGAALHLLGIVQRTTRDVDVVAFTERPDSHDALRRPPDPFPPALDSAVRQVAKDFDLPTGWLNRGPAGQWDVGLPAGFLERITWRQFASLDVGIAGRLDLIFLKIEAAADQPDSRNRHFEDLLALRPAPREVERAVAWAKEKNVGPEYHAFIDKLASHVRSRLEGNARQA